MNELMPIRYRVMVCRPALVIGRALHRCAVALNWLHETQEALRWLTADVPHEMIPEAARQKLRAYFSRPEGRDK